MEMMNEKVNWFFEMDTPWQEEYKSLRKIILTCGLTEELKWGVPCYTWQKKNVVLIHGFKEYCALLFHKGALLANGDGLLIQQTENVQSARQMRFTNLKEIINGEAIIQSTIVEAIEVEKAGLKVPLKKTKEFHVPVEFLVALDGSPELKTAFEALTPGRQRGYLLHFSQPKQSNTRKARIEKSIPKIFAGKGWNDQ